MQRPELEEEMRRFKQMFEKATSENIIEYCQKYLGLLTAYRDELYKFRGTPEINQHQKSLVKRAAVDLVRQKIRTAVENCTSERNRIETLLKSFIVISGYDALETFNQHHYKGFSNWELKAGGLRFGGGTEADKISVQDAVATASLLRREEYLNPQTISVN
ncbi:MAG: hypothetical protein ABI954_04555 [Pyrinomonadaceae bacterium]